MAQRISDAIDETPAATFEELHWAYLEDLGAYPLTGFPASGATALHGEWLRLDRTDKPIPERVELLIRFAKSLGIPDWAVRARTLVGQASARRRAANPQKRTT
jgi:hypothetical protein